MENKFSDGSTSGFAELPVPAAYLSWTRGNAQLRSIAKDDPGAYLGGWRAFFEDKEKQPLPSLPIPIVERMSEDGKHAYKVYASNYINFLPIQHRTRFELREKTKDDTTGREYDRVVSISKERRQGYAPYRQVFGLLFANDTDDYAPAVIKVYKWSAFIAFEKAGQIWNKVDKSTPDGRVLIRRYGTLGKKEDKIIVPVFEVFGQGRSTPIEAVGVNKPRWIVFKPEFDTLWEQSVEWANCPRWNAEGKVQETEDETASVAQKDYEARCYELNFTNIEADALLKENGGDYVRALAALQGDAINAALEQGDIMEESPF